MLYQKKFPEKRQPFFMAIVSSHLAATAPTALENDKRIFGALAYRLLAKAASDTVENLTTSQKAVRVLRSAGDLHLLTTVYRSQGKYKEALDILNDDRIGLLSKLGANSWDLVREKISLCELNHSWEELWQFCRQLLTEAIDHDKECSENDSSKPRSLGFGKFGDDWTVWAAFIGAAAAAETSEYVCFAIAFLVILRVLGSPPSQKKLLTVIWFAVKLHGMLVWRWSNILVEYLAEFLISRKTSSRLVKPTLSAILLPKSVLKTFITVPTFWIYLDRPHC